ncbi:MAG: hypothetical protein GY822_09275 [Deltaproteobacteria bacterium]|nr:hypothetical protein [Deltaproteobacteria bacterium]
MHAWSFRRTPFTSLPLAFGLCISLWSSSSWSQDPADPDGNGEKKNDEKREVSSPDEVSAEQSDEVKRLMDSKKMEVTSSDPADEGLSQSATKTSPKTKTMPLEALDALTCPKEQTCIDDEELVSLLLSYRRLLETESTEGRPRTQILLDRMAHTGDPRVVPILLRASRSSSTEMRGAALRGLSRFAYMPAARDRLLATLKADAPLKDAEAALPGILTSHLGPIPCPKNATCSDDSALLAALMAVSGGTTSADVHAGLRALGALADPRGLSVLLSYSRARGGQTRRAALVALTRFNDERATRKVRRTIQKGGLLDAEAVLVELLRHPTPAVTEMLLVLRKRKGKDAQHLANSLLKESAPEVLAALLAKEKQERLEKERALQAEDQGKKIAQQKVEKEKRIRRQLQEKTAKLAREKHEKEQAERTAFALRYGSRVGVAFSAGLAGLYGGASAASHIASLVSTDDQAITETLYAAYGGGVGMASAAALSWFLMSDVELTVPDVGLTTTTSYVGAWVGGWTPGLLFGEIADDRIVGYSAALGHLGGLSAGALAAAYLDPTWQDLAEINTFVVAANVAAAGMLLAAPGDLDLRLVSGAYIGASLLGTAAGAAATYGHDLDTRDFIHLSTLSISVAGAGFFAGLASSSFGGSGFEGAMGGSLLGVSSGLMAGIGLAAIDVTPGVGGSMYQLYASGTGAIAGLGAGLLFSYVTPELEGIPREFAPLAMGAMGALSGTASTALVPDGISLDVGDLLLQPLIVGLALYQTGVLGIAAGADFSLVAGASLLVPATVSLGLAHTAPLISPSLGDVMMVGFGSVIGASVSALMMTSIAGRMGDNVSPWMWVAATGIGMDLGVIGGLGLDLIDVDKLGWKVTYVAAVTAGTSLVLSFPGALLVPLSGNVVQVSDVVLASAGMGLALGLGTVLLMDFDIVPDLHWDEHIPLDLPEGLLVQPSFAPLPSTDGKAVIPTVGLAGTF